MARRFASCPVVLADLREIPFKRESFTAVWAIASLLHVSRERIAHTLAEVCDVVLPRGVFVASIKLGRGEAYDRSGRLFSYYGCDEWKALIENAGFEIELLEKDKEERWSQHGEDLSVNWLMVAARKPVRF
jgi:SAM-dependent methyltransferase